MESEMLRQIKGLSEPRSSSIARWLKTLLYFRNNISWLIMGGGAIHNIKNLGIVGVREGLGGQRDLKSRYGGVDQFSLAEKMHLWGQRALETTVYLKVNLFTLLQWQAGCLITALNKNIMWARAFAPLPTALFTSTQVVRHHLFLLPIFDSRHIK